MKVTGTFLFRGPREAVWDLLQDPAVLAKAMPGAERLERTEGDRFEGSMKVSLGPVTAARFTLVVELADKAAPERFAMRIDSQGPLGFTRGKALVELTPVDEGTMMSYSSDLQIGGRIAAVGQRVIDMAARMMTEKGLESLQKELDARLAGGSRA
ncbi:MAG: carbon monoxide dehydrogenase subunit G [Acidobacteriota bacterium]